MYSPEEIWKYAMVYAGKRSSSRKPSSRRKKSSTRSSSRKGAAFGGAKVALRNKDKYIFNPAGENVNDDSTFKPIKIPPDYAQIKRGGEYFYEMRERLGDIGALKHFSKLLQSEHYTPSKRKSRSKSRKSSKRADTQYVTRSAPYHHTPATVERFFEELEEAKHISEGHPATHRAAIEELVSENPEYARLAESIIDSDSGDSDDSDDWNYAAYKKRIGMGKKDLKKILRGATRKTGVKRGASRAGRAPQGTPKKRGSQMKARGKGMIGGGTRQGDCYRT